MSGQDMRILMEAMKRRFRPNPGWIIMNARALMERPRSSLQQIMDVWSGDTMTVMVVSVENPSYGKPNMPRFVVGSENQAYGDIGSTTPWTNDTGNGYRSGTSLIVENYFFIKKGQIVEQVNRIGENEKRSVWVFK